MKSSFILLKNKKVLAKAQALLKLISVKLADLNDVPMHLYQYRGSKNTDFRDISKSIDELEKIFTPYLSALTEQEIMQFLNSIHPMLLEHVKRYKFGNLISNTIIEIISWELLNTFFNLDKYVEEDFRRGVVFRTFKKLSVQDDGLIMVDSNFQLENHGIILNRNHLIYYHPLLRRFYTANFTIGPLLKKVSKTKNINLQIAIDPYRLTKPKYLKNIFEFDFWYGPPFSVGKMDDINFTGVTVHKRVQKPFGSIWQIDRTVFHISNKEIGYKQIEIEEINPPAENNYSTKYVMQKYAHMIWDTNKKSFSHLDCAVRVYSKLEHEKRFLYDWKAKKVGDEAQTIGRIKLFRMDGIIEIDLAMSLLADFFRYNELIYEFFSGQKFPIA